MNTYDIISLSISLVAIAISVWAARRQVGLSQRSYELDARNLAATHHGEYSELLFEVRREVQDAREHLSSAARDSLNDLCELFDRLGKSSKGRPTRHLFHEVCELVYQAFRGQLGWQTGLNLANRFTAFRNPEHYTPVHPSDRRRLEARAAKEELDFDRAYKEDPNQLLENLLFSSARFQLLQLELLERVQPESRNDLLQRAIPKVRTYLSARAEEREDLSEARGRLRQALERNSLQEFPLYESPALYRKFSKELAELDALIEIRPAVVESLVDFEVPFPLAELTYAGGILYSIQSSWSWGRES